MKSNEPIEVITLSDDELEDDENLKNFDNWLQHNNRRTSISNFSDTDQGAIAPNPDLEAVQLSGLDLLRQMVINEAEAKNQDKLSLGTDLCRLTCNVCKQSIRTLAKKMNGFHAQSLHRHALVHSEKSWYGCAMCPQCFKTIIGHSLHMKKKHELKMQDPEYCRPKIQSEMILKQEISHWMRQCFSLSYNGTLLEEDRSSATAEQTPISSFSTCNVCCQKINRVRSRRNGKLFQQPQLLRNHTLVHIQKDLYKCSQCAESLETPIKLSEHVSLVHGQRISQIPKSINEKVVETSRNEVIILWMKRCFNADFNGAPLESTSVDALSPKLGRARGRDKPQPNGPPLKKAKISAHISETSTSANREKKQESTCSSFDSQEPKRPSFKKEIYGSHRFFCNACSQNIKGFTSKHGATATLAVRQLHLHAMTHSKKSLFHCLHCKQTFNTSYKLQTHAKNVHRMRLSECTSENPELESDMKNEIDGLMAFCFKLDFAGNPI